MANGIIGDRWLRSRCVCAPILLISLGPSTVLGQSPASSDASKPASTPPAPKPAASPVPKPATPDSSMEDRLRRMEEAYRRIEEANKKIQGQYDGLLKKYEELNGQLKSARGDEPGRASSATTRPASRVGAVEYQEPPGRAVSEGIGAQGMGGRTAPGGPSGFGAEGIEARGVFREGGGLPPTTATGGGSPSAPVGVSRRAAEGIGARGTGGRTYPTETVSRGEEKVPRRLGKVEFAEGLEISSADDEFKLTFHNLTQAEIIVDPKRWTTQATCIC